MKALSSSMLALALAAMPIICSPAATDKTLQAKQGTVTYGAASIPTTKLAKNASATLNDNDYAATGANSLADLTLPDSSVVLLGENSNVQMKNFSAAGGTNTANFFVIGKVRFKVEHPAGAKASYTFQTPTGQIAVRGTEGDIFSQPGPNGGPGGLQVNVYQLTNPALPVQVSLVNGQVFTLAAGQSLVVTAAAAGALVGAVGAVSNSTFAPFTQLGAPANASSLGITTTTTAAAGTTAAATTAATTASVTTAAVAAGTAAAVAVTSGNTKPEATPTPTPTPSPTPTPTIAPTMTPSPAPTGTSVPITISGKPGTGTLSPGAVNPPGPATMPGLPGTGTRVIQPPHPIGRPTPPHP